MKMKRGKTEESGFRENSSPMESEEESFLEELDLDDE